LLLTLVPDEKIRSDYSIDMPSKNCPQAITEDNNCMFWTLLLTVTLIVNKNSTIDEVSSAILTCYDTKEKLADLMIKFKKFIIELAKDNNITAKTAGKRRKTNKLKLKNRKTRKNTKPKKRVYLRM
jgi:hypothetical protein